METTDAPQNYAFLFVCHQGELEIKSLLLAASLRRFLRCPAEIIVGIPEPKETWGTPSDGTLAGFRQMDVQLVPITNSFGKDYPIGNKLGCIQVPTTAEKLVFVDSDVLCMAPFDGGSRFAVPFNAKPADHMTYGTDEARWREVYDLVGVPMPSTRITATVSHDVGPPYFNAGFVAFNRDIRLPAIWLEYCRAITRNDRLANFNSPPPHKNYWLDQVALAVAIVKLGVRYDCLDERYNYPANLKPLDPSNLPYFCHYHTVDIVRQEPCLSALVRSLADEYDAVAQAVEQSVDWKALVRRSSSPIRRPRGIVRPFAALMPSKRCTASNRRPALLITGIPRSGTSYLCSLLHHYSNCVIINEPPELLHILAAETLPWSVPSLYRKLRSDICAGTPVPNKLSGGRLIQDTLGSDEISLYTPRVDNDDFILGTKNTLAYLTRLEGIRRVMPDVRILVCVRNPFDTIASWKTSFPHLRDAEISGLPVGNDREPWLTELQRRTLTTIGGTTNLAERRAMRWRYLAERILEQGRTVTLVRYREVITEPLATLERILNGLPKGRVREPITPLTPRSKRDVLDPADLQAIRAICSQSAADLAVAL